MKPTTDSRKPPKSLKKPGKSLWIATLDQFIFDSEHQYHLLEHAGRMLDVATAARAEVEKRGLLLPDRFGVLKENPAAAIERQSLNAYRLACREMNLDVEPKESRGPRRF